MNKRNTLLVINSQRLNKTHHSQKFKELIRFIQILVQFKTVKLQYIYIVILTSYQVIMYYYTKIFVYNHPWYIFNGVQYIFKTILYYKIKFNCISIKKGLTVKTICKVKKG